MSIGTRMKAARKEAGLTQEELARRADVSTVAVYQIEQGRTKQPHYDTLHNLGQVLGVSTHWLYTGQEVEESVGKAGTPQRSGPLCGTELVDLAMDALRRDDERERQAYHRATEIGEGGEPQVAVGEAEGEAKRILLERSVDPKFAEALFVWARAKLDEEQESARLREDVARLQEENVKLRARLQEVEGTEQLR